MKKFRLKKWMIVVVILVMAIILVTLVNRWKKNDADTAMSDPLSVVGNIIAAPGRWIGSIDSISSLTNTYQENEKLRGEIEQYDDLKQKVKNQAQEIERLKVEEELNKTLTDYEKVSATVINRTPDTWQDILTVDKGSSDGVTENMAVMSQKGVICRVTKVKKQSSEIELLASDNQNSNHFPIKIGTKNGDSFGILNKYEEKAQQLIASQVTKEKEIKEGDIVRTSGLGGNSPADLVIGTVVKVKPSSNGIDFEVYIKPYAQMYDISFVTIIKGMAE
ncbi:rod shape-determining protein MreC [Enterococcus raffinosus]|uniref:rod shape-determining protein MreC n=1 Tax=Enterococcus raffinosus TaxID=71452 RepID=UPI001C0FF8F1|nr:rod shape-determining protein MreC [Enterococcus raffinosus]